MTQVLLCAGPGLLVVKKDGLLFYRRPGQPDTPVPYAPAHYPVFLRSAKEKHDLTPVVGPAGEEAPGLPEESTPVLCLDRLPSGVEVYRLMAATVEAAGQPDESRAPFPARDEKTAQVPN